MKKRLFELLGIGFLKYILFNALTMFAICFSFTDWGSNMFIVICTALSFLHIIMFIGFNKTQSTKEIILKESLSSCLGFIIIVLDLVIRNSVDFSVLPRYITDQLDDNYGAGLMMLLSYLIYGVSVLVLKIIILVIMAIRRYYRNQTDISNIPPPRVETGEG